MLNRKVNKASNGGIKTPRRGRERVVSNKARPLRRRFIISAKSAGHAGRQPGETRNGHSKISPQSKMPVPSQPNASPATPGTIDLAETIKTLLHLAQENGYVTYDDINDILPDGLTPDDLDELYTKLRTLEVEIVDQAEVEIGRASCRERVSNCV